MVVAVVGLANVSYGLTGADQQNWARGGAAALQAVLDGAPVVVGGRSLQADERQFLKTVSDN
ncbi:hypothetical protein CASFOL_035646 [Castilleja foliolosa]|uniref:Uncharacterized protein n=1 Tax=Castilleja foliolosa TaxID=1961234 RepID=A0ABD3BU47_9LAMI